MTASPVINAKSSDEKTDIVDDIGVLNASCPLGSGTTALTHGVTVTSSLPATTGASCEFSFVMSNDPITSSKVELFGLASDYDLYVKRGSAPTTTVFDCRPFSGGLTAETCTLANSPPGTEVFIMVRRFSGSGAFSIRASEVIPPPTCSLGHGVHALADSVTANLTSDAGANCMFKFTPDTAADFASIRMTLTSSDFDLYVRKGAQPTTTTYDCRPFSGGTVAEQCDTLITDSSDFFVMVRRFSGSGAFTVTGTNVIIPTLENGVPVQGQVAQGAVQYWKIVVPAASDVGNTSALAVALLGDPSALACAEIAAAEAGADCESGDGACEANVDPLAPDTCAAIGDAVDEGCLALGGCPAAPETGADADLYVRRAVGLPTTTAYDCRPFAYGSTEACAFSNDAVAADAAAGEALAAIGDAIGEGACVDPTIPESCVDESTVPSGIPETGISSILPFAGAGKYFIAVRGFSGTSDYVLAAAYA